MNCNTCGAPVTPGVTICEYCGNALSFGGGPAPSPAMAPPGGQRPGGPMAGGGATAGGATRALAPDGCWYPVAASPMQGGRFLVRYSDGRQATVTAEEVRPPCDPSRLRPGARVLGEYEGHYFPGVVMDGSGGTWNIRFDDGETAPMTCDRLCAWDLAEPPLQPGTAVLAQSRQDGAWYAGRIMSGPDQTGRQRVRIDAGGVEICSRFQINGPAGPHLLQPGKRVLGIGPDGYWYPGTVQQAAQGQVYVRFDDNEEAWMLAHEVRYIC